MIFDGDCGFCTTSAGWIERRLPDRVRVAPWQILDLDDYDLTEADVTTAAYWVDDDGATHRGHLGIGKSLISAGGIWWLPGQLIIHPPISWLAKPIYGWIAKNRHLMPGASEACRVDLSDSAGATGAPSRD